MSVVSCGGCALLCRLTFPFNILKQKFRVYFDFEVFSKIPQTAKSFGSYQLAESFIVKYISYVPIS